MGFLFCIFVYMGKKKAYIKRDYREEGTYGVFFFDDKDRSGRVISLASLELPWKNNQKMISCIPEGTYQVKTTWSPANEKMMWQIMDVPNRSGIRFDVANYISQLLGCVTTGLSFEDINGDGVFDVTSSAIANKIAREHLGDEFELTFEPTLK